MSEAFYERSALSAKHAVSEALNEQNELKTPFARETIFNDICIYTYITHDI